MEGEGEDLVPRKRRPKKPRLLDVASYYAGADLEGVNSIEEMFQDTGVEQRGEQQEVEQERTSTKAVQMRFLQAEEWRPVNVAVGGEVATIRSMLTDGDLQRFMSHQGRQDGVTVRLSRYDEVAYLDMSPEICLFDHMFKWGMRTVLGENKPPGQVHMAAIFVHYGLPPGQVNANSFLYVMGFWAFMFQEMGEETPASAGPFAHFFDLKELRKQGSYYFSLRKKSLPAIPGFDSDTMAVLKKMVPVVGVPSHPKKYQEKFVFANMEENPF